MRPSAFDSFRNFVRWRDTVTSVIWLVLSQAVRDTWVAAPAEGSGGSSGGEASARMLLARLKGGLRRLDVRVADDYDDAEYGEAAEAVFGAADQLAQRCQTGGAGAVVGWGAGGSKAPFPEAEEEAAVWQRAALRG